jgi:hypothetical protein
MTYVKIAGGQVATYPYTIDELRADHPDTAFSKGEGADYSDFGVFAVEENPPPATTVGQIAIEQSPTLINGVWQQTWSVRSKTGAELTDAKDTKAELVEAMLAAKERDGSAPTAKGAVKTSDSSKIKINGLVVMAQLAISQGQPFSQQLTMADGEIKTLNAAEMIGVGVAVGTYVSALYAHARALTDAIYDADSFADLSEVDVEAGWP